MISKLAVKWVALVSLAAFCPAFLGAGKAEGLPLTNISQIRALPAAELEKQPRVRLEAAVTLYVPTRLHLWVQDGQDVRIQF